MKWARQAPPGCERAATISMMALSRRRDVVADSQWVRSSGEAGVFARFVCWPFVGPVVWKVRTFEEHAHNGRASARRDGRVTRPLAPCRRGLCAFEEIAHNGLGCGHPRGRVRRWLGAATGLCASMEHAQNGHASARRDGRVTRRLAPWRRGLCAFEVRRLVATLGWRPQPGPVVTGVRGGRARGVCWMEVKR